MAIERLDEALRQLRRNRGLKQSELAQAAGVSMSHVSRYETGANAPAIGTLGRLLDGMGCDLHDLQDALDQLGGREPRRRPEGKVDQVALARLRLRYPDAPSHLLVERAQVEQELADALARADRLQHELEAAAGAHQVAEAAPSYGAVESSEAERRDALERTRRAIATRKGMTPREGTND